MEPRRSYHQAKAAAIEAFERAFLANALTAAGGKIAEAARSVSIGRVYLTKLLRKYRVTP